MLYSMLFIAQTGGMIEMHVHIFGPMAFLLVYRSSTAILVRDPALEEGGLVSRAADGNGVRYATSTTGCTRLGKPAPDPTALYWLLAWCTRTRAMPALGPAAPPH
jgi:hypothetical protein